MQARNEIIQARTDAVNYKEEGNERMRELLSAMSSVRRKCGGGWLRSVWSNGNQRPHQPELNEGSWYGY